MGSPWATASSMISAMNTEQCWPRDTPLGLERHLAEVDDVADPAELSPLLLDERAGAREHASFMAASTTRPSLSRMYLAS